MYSTSELDELFQILNSVKGFKLNNHKGATQHRGSTNSSTLCWSIMILSCPTGSTIGIVSTGSTGLIGLTTASVGCVSISGWGVGWDGWGTLLALLVSLYLWGKHSLSFKSSAEEYPPSEYSVSDTSSIGGLSFLKILYLLTLLFSKRLVWYWYFFKSLCKWAKDSSVMWCGGFFICCLSVATINLHLSISSLSLLYSDLAFSNLCLLITVAWNSSRTFVCF